MRLTSSLNGGAARADQRCVSATADAETPPPQSPSLLALPGGGLRIWTTAVLRGAGFPVKDLLTLGDPDFADAIDAMTEQQAAAGGPVIEAGEHRQHVLLADIAARTDFQLAVGWQNSEVLRTSVLPLAARPAKRNQTTKRKEKVVARYWARYCAKNDSIGFFGPICWTEMRDSGPVLDAQIGAHLVEQSSVHMEGWAYDTLAWHFSTDARVRPWVAPRLNPSAMLLDQQVFRTEGLPVPLELPVWRVLTCADGVAAACRLAENLIAHFPADYPDVAAVFEILESLVIDGHLLWDLEPPLMMRPDRMLRASIDALEPSDIRAELTASIDRLDAALARLAAASEPAELDSAIAALDATFTELTQSAPRRRAGETYGGRQIAYMDSRRDAHITFGPGLLERMGPPLSMLSWSLRSLTAELAKAYETSFLGGYAVIRASSEIDRVWLAHLLGICSRELFEPGSRVFEPVLKSFGHRWDRLLELDRGHSGEVRFTSAELWPHVREMFADASPGWAHAFQHSADIQISAQSATDVAAGNFSLVLGELHAAWNTIEAGVFVDQHPKPDQLGALLDQSGPRPRVLLVPVKHYPRVSVRTAPMATDERAWSLALTHYPGGDPARRISLAEMYVERQKDGLWCHTHDGRASFRVIDVLGMLISAEIMDAFKLLGRESDHTPRVWVDGMVVVRESWSISLADMQLPPSQTSEATCFRAVRQMAHELGLPRIVFVKISGEMKPFFVDLTSLVQVSALLTALRAAVNNEPGSQRVRFTEMLPAPDNAWLAGPAGERFTSELRVQLVDSDEWW